MVEESGYFDEVEAGLVKGPEVYTQFVYDNETGGGVIELFYDVFGSSLEEKGMWNDVLKLHEEEGKIYSNAMYDRYADLGE